MSWRLTRKGGEQRARLAVAKLGLFKKAVAPEKNDKHSESEVEWKLGLLACLLSSLYSIQIHWIGGRAGKATCGRGCQTGHVACLREVGGGGRGCPVPLSRILAGAQLFCDLPGT